MLFPWYVVLCAAQGGLVAFPLRRRGPRRHHRMLGVVLPAIALLTGVGTIRLLAGGAESLAWLATVATPILAAAVGWSLGWRAPAAPIPIAVTLWLVAWQFGGHIAEAARVLLVGAACLTLAAWLAALAPDRPLTLGLVLLVVVDASLVWATHQVNPAATALHHAPLPSISFACVPHQPPTALHGDVPSISFAGLARRPLPALQDVTLGNSSMGWVDFFAPAALGMLFTDTATGVAEPQPA